MTANIILHLCLLSFQVLCSISLEKRVLMSPSQLMLQKRNLKPPGERHGYCASGGAASGKEREGRKPGRKEKDFLKVRTPGLPIQCHFLYVGGMCPNFITDLP